MGKVVGEMEISTDIPFGPLAFVLSVYSAAFCNALALRKGLPRTRWIVLGLLCGVFAVISVLRVSSRNNGNKDPAYVSLIAVSAALPLVLFAHLVRLGQAYLQQTERVEGFVNGGVWGLLLLLFTCTLLLLAFPLERSRTGGLSPLGRGFVLALAAYLLVGLVTGGHKGARAWICVRCGRLKEVRHVSLLDTRLYSRVRDEPGILTPLRVRLLGPCTHDWRLAVYFAHGAGSLFLDPPSLRDIKILNDHALRWRNPELLQALERLPDDAACRRALIDLMDPEKSLHVERRLLEGRAGPKPL